eukprot:m.28452 g.28452  ORF g.28452 m.28452 type:complete len:320 (-) comp9041_c0_seq1:140-1099(-)
MATTVTSSSLETQHCKGIVKALIDAVELLEQPAYEADSLPPCAASSSARPVSHNDVEKRRRAYLSACFRHLQENIPSIESTRASNAVILQAAQQFIEELHAEERTLLDQKRNLSRQHALLEAQAEYGEVFVMDMSEDDDTAFGDEDQDTGFETETDDEGGDMDTQPYVQHVAFGTGRRTIAADADMDAEDTLSQSDLATHHDSQVSSLHSSASDNGDDDVVPFAGSPGSASQSSSSFNDLVLPSSPQACSEQGDGLLLLAEALHPKAASPTESSSSISKPSSLTMAANAGKARCPNTRRFRRIPAVSIHTAPTSFGFSR